MKKNKLKRHTFTHNERPHILEMLPILPKTVTLSTGKHVMVNYANPNFKRNASQINKNIKTFLYSKLIEMGLPTDSYIVNLDMPKVIRNTVRNSYVGLTITFPNQNESELSLNEPFASVLSDYFHKEIQTLTL